MSRHVLSHLSRADAVLGGLIRAVGPCRLEPPAECHPFQTLAQAIAHQQLNGTAANTILGRFVASCGDGSFPTPQAVLAANETVLRAAGFSFAKIASLRDLAAKTLDGVVPSREVLIELENEAIIERLTQVRGIGRWTVEMMLMFHLRRPDVLPVDDYSLRKAYAKAFNKRKLPTPQALEKLGEKWRPYRTVASWYLWSTLNTK